MIREALLCVVGTIPLVLAIAWLTTQFNYRITRTHLEVTLFGFRVRRLPLDAIRSMSARRLREGEWGEQWWNTLKPSRRFLTLKLSSGFFKFFVITPNHRYIFKAELKQAISELKGKAAAAAVDESDTDFLDADADADADTDSDTNANEAANVAGRSANHEKQPAAEQEGNRAARG